MSKPVIDQAHAFLRAHSRGDLRFEENVRPIKYVIAPDGRLIAPVMVAMLRSFDTVLFVPDDADGSMELQVTLLEFQERGPDGALADRWRIYHGEPEDVRWATLQIDAARFGEMVIDGSALMRDNPLASDESRLCKQINTQRAAELKQMCDQFGTMQVESPVMVGIDPLGIDVRARFDVVRVSAIEPMNTAADAERILKAMMEQPAPISSNSPFKPGE